MPQTSDETIPPALVDEALERVLASRGFRGAARKQRFLRFIVQQTQAGHADRIKAYTIAMDVFDRDASFDPLLDPVVRIQAGRIRRCLEQYYLTEGAEDTLRISIPKGSYVPRFTRHRPATVPDTPPPGPAADPAPAARDAGAPDLQAPEFPVSDGPVSHEPASQGPAFQGAMPLRPPSPVDGAMPRRATLPVVASLLVLVLLVGAAVWSAFMLARPRGGDGQADAMHGPSLLVLPLTNATGDPSQDLIAEGFTEDLIGALIRFKSVLVFGADTSFRYRSAPALNDAEPGTRIDYVLKGSVGRVGDQIQVTVMLINTKNHQYIWSESFRRDVTPATLMDLRRDIAVLVARALAQPSGVIFTEEARSSAVRAPKALHSYECLLQVRQYWRALDAAGHGRVRDCLEQAVRTDPLYADAWAALAMVTIDEARLGFNPVAARPDPLAEGLRLATHAVALGPDAPLPLQALGLAHWLRREPRLSIAAYERALALNPHDSDILADLGRCYSLVGDWQRGIPLIQEAYVRNPALPSWYHIVVATYHYMGGRYDDALAEARRIDAPDVVLAHVALAMIHAQAGHKDDAAREVGEILRLDPGYGGRIRSDLERRNIAPATIAGVLDGVRKAGLDVPPD